MLNNNNNNTPLLHLLKLLRPCLYQIPAWTASQILTHCTHNVI